jgi:two-component system, LytTR family, sensor kinase
MGDNLISKLDKRRSFRHLVFWVAWVVGFTFIKSFGESWDVYLGWFSYYLITLPIFVAHTYLVAYLLVPFFLNKRYFPVFILLFLLFFYGFSVLELILSNEFIYKWYQTGSELVDHYLAMSNVIRSGLGNLYIVLVFLAMKTIREWYHADTIRKELQHIDLQQQLENALTRVQPRMLLYAIDHIDRMVDHDSPDVTRAIALTSELLNEVMIYYEEHPRLFSEEIDLVRKLVVLVSLLRDSKPDVEFFISGDPGQIKMPPMILFTLVDIIFRKFEEEPTLPELNIEASGFSNMITIQILYNTLRKHDEVMLECLQTMRQIEDFYRDQVSMNIETHSYGCSVIVRRADSKSANTIHPQSDAINTPKKVIN